jgi:integrase
MARAKHREWLSDIEARITNLRAERKGQGTTLTPGQARALSGEWYLWWTERHLEKQELKYWEEFYEHLTDEAYFGAVGVTGGLEAPPGWSASEVFERDFAARAEARAIAADSAETSQFLHSKRLTLEPASRELFLDYVCRDLFDALRLLIRRAKRDYGEDLHPKQFPKFERTGHPTLSPLALFERWVMEKKPARTTIERWRTPFQHLQKDFPDVSASALTHEQAWYWCEQLIKDGHSRYTVNNVWRKAGRTVFQWGVQQRVLSRNPFDGIKITVERKIKTRDKSFNADEIKTILRAASAITDTKKKTMAARRWCPWLCAYTGARVGEITQLRGIDVIEQDAAIHITPEAGTVKTREPKTVPLHEHLIAQGFLDFVKASGKGPLFYKERERSSKKRSSATGDPTEPTKTPYAKARQYLADWVRKELGITDRAIQPNHAWRHTFKLIGGRYGMRDKILDAICGHAAASEGSKYAKPQLIDMAQELKKFPRYEID